VTIADLCLLAAFILTHVSVMPAKLDGREDYDNANPRNPGFYRQGLRARALGAHQNGFEIFPFFAVAVILAEMRGVQQSLVDLQAIAFILVRIVYVLLYLTNRPSARSAVWAIGVFCSLLIFFSPFWANR
jgi:uncharacterized MAPEG superfamily protein